MRETVRQAARATVQLALAVGLTVFSYVFVTVLLITAIGTIAILGAWLLPETVLLIRRIAGAKRSMTAAWTGREIPDAYQPINGSLRSRLRTAVRDPGTYVDLRWMAANYGYGALGLLGLPLWLAGVAGAASPPPAGPPADQRARGPGRGLVGRAAAAVAEGAADQARRAAYPDPGGRNRRPQPRTAPHRTRPA